MVCLHRIVVKTGLARETYTTFNGNVAVYDKSGCTENDAESWCLKRIRSHKEKLSETMLEHEQKIKSDLENKEEQLNSALIELEQANKNMDKLRKDLKVLQENFASDCTTTTSSTDTSRGEQSGADTTGNPNTSTNRLYMTRTQIAQVREQLEKFANFTPVCSPNSDVSNHWERFFGGVVTEEKLDVLPISIQKLGKFEVHFLFLNSSSKAALSHNIIYIFLYLIP